MLIYLVYGIIIYGAILFLGMSLCHAAAQGDNNRTQILNPVPVKPAPEFQGSSRTYQHRVS